MSSDGRMHVSPEALLHLIDALRRHQAKVDAAASDVNLTLGARLRQMNERFDEVRSEVRQLQSDLSACDEDEDREYLRGQLERAEERRDRLERRIGEVADALGSFKRSRAGIQESISQRIPRAIAYLEAKHAELVGYLSVTLPGEHRTAAVGEQAIRSVAVDDAPAASSTRDLASFFLPDGFQWVRLDKISRADDLRVEEKFSKVSLEEVENGFQLLRDEVLPALQIDAASAAEILRQRDGEKGRPYENGALRVFEAFFGESHVALTRRTGDNQFGVTNGRHRISVARRLGWSSIPARLV